MDDVGNRKCGGCPCAKRSRVVIHLEDDPGYETEQTILEAPDEEGLLYDNLD